jgi:F0F1-type ATP synthase assembly protein I
MKNNKWISFVGIGIEAVAIIMVSVWLGLWMDNYLELKNLFSTILPLLGLAGWVYHVILMVKKISKE